MPASFWLEDCKSLSEWRLHTGSSISSLTNHMRICTVLAADHLHSTQNREMCKGNGNGNGKLICKKRWTNISYPPMFFFGVNRTEFSIFCIKSKKPQKNSKNSSGTSLGLELCLRSTQPGSIWWDCPFKNIRPFHHILTILPQHKVGLLGLNSMSLLICSSWWGDGTSRNYVYEFFGIFGTIN